MKKLIFICLLFVGLSATGFAQSDKMKEKANAAIEKLNKDLVGIDKSLALTEDQKTKIYDIQINRLKELKEIQKAESDKEKRKEISKPVNKKYYKMIYTEVLTKKQRMERSEARKKNKGNK